MPIYLIRVEAVNFGSFILDTADLSTIRGGGLLLLEIELEDFAKESGLGPAVSYGASITNYEVVCPGQAEADELCRRIETALGRKPEFAEASIFAAAAPLAGTDVNGWQAAVRDTRTAIRWMQMQSPTVVYPNLIATDIDPLDGVRPAKRRADFWRKSETGEAVEWVVSDVTYERRLNGVARKHRDYSKRFGCPETQQFVNDLEQMSDFKGKRLDGKVAVIHLDGNSFGQTFSLQGKEGYQKLATGIRENHRAFMGWLLGEKATDVDWLWSGTVYSNKGTEIKKRDAMRLETLVWGGDEITWVVPAWCGWWMLGEFFRQFGPVDGVRLTHKAAIVFCHHKAPIQRITALVNTLADSAKDGTNRMTYQVLESFDHLGVDATTLRDARLPALLQGTKALLVAGDSMLRLPAPLSEFRRRFPRSKLHRILQLYRSAEAEAAKLGKEELSENAMEGKFGEIQAALGLDGGLTELQKTAATWIHIADLWDYVAIEGGAR